jgi:DNA invertase Pin-like site-specific DNA recombinase
MRLYGYVRVSSKEQNEQRQLDAMEAIEDIVIFTDKASGKDFDRPEYTVLKKVIKKGDTLYIQSLDRLGRDYNGVMKEWNELTKEKGIDIVVLDMPLLDTRKHKDLLGTFVSDLVLQVLSFVANQERDNIKKRQAQGIESAKAQGKHLGRPKATVTSEFKQAYTAWKAGSITAVEAMKQAKMTKTTFYKMVKEHEQN